MDWAEKPQNGKTELAFFISTEALLNPPNILFNVAQKGGLFRNENKQKWWLWKVLQAFFSKGEEPFARYVSHWVEPTLIRSGPLKVFIPFWSFFWVLSVRLVRTILSWLDYCTHRPRFDCILGLGAWHPLQQFCVSDIVSVRDNLFIDSEKEHKKTRNNNLDN